MQKTAIEHYGYDIMFMLYRAMHDYLKGEEALVEALEKVIGYIFTPKHNQWSFNFMSLFDY